MSVLDAIAATVGVVRILATVVAVELDDAEDRIAAGLAELWRRWFGVDLSEPSLR